MSRAIRKPRDQFGGTLLEAALLIVLVAVAAVGSLKYTGEEIRLNMCKGAAGTVGVTNEAWVRFGPDPLGGPDCCKAKQFDFGPYVCVQYLN